MQRTGEQQHEPYESEHENDQTITFVDLFHDDSKLNFMMEFLCWKEDGAEEESEDSGSK